MALNDITFVKGQGGLGRPLPGEDHISGFIIFKDKLPSGINNVDPWVTGTNYVIGDLVEEGGKVYKANADHLASAAFATDIANWDEQVDTKYRAKKYLTLESIEDDGITEGNADWGVLWYHLKEFFRLNPKGELWLFVGNVPAGAHTFSEVEKLQDFADGKIRQVGVYVDNVAFDKAQIPVLNNIASGLFDTHKPLSILYTADFSAVNDWSQDNAGGGVDDMRGLASAAPYVSVIIGQDGANAGKTLFDSIGKTISCIGAALGVLSKAKVSENIGWVGKFPLAENELDVPALANGDLVKDISEAVLGSLQDKGFIFLRKHVGKNNTYFNDSPTCTPAVSDYAYIENERTIDKATRNVRTSLLDELNGPVFVDPATGRLSEDYIAYLKSLGDEALAQMERDGELAGYQTIINPEQDVLATSEVEVSIENVPVGVSRNFKVKINYVKKLSA